jgi:hypothetical protein
MLPRPNEESGFTSPGLSGNDPMLTMKLLMKSYGLEHTAGSLERTFVLIV